MTREQFLKDGRVRYIDAKMERLLPKYLHLYERYVTDDPPNECYLVEDYARPLIASALWPQPQPQPPIDGEFESWDSKTAKVAEANALTVMAFVRASKFNAINANQPLQDHYNEAEGYIEDALRILKGLE